MLNAHASLFPESGFGVLGELGVISVFALANLFRKFRFFRGSPPMAALDVLRRLRPYDHLMGFTGTGLGGPSRSFVFIILPPLFYTQTPQKTSPTT